MITLMTPHPPRPGGRLLIDRTTVTGVGHLVCFADPADNVVGAMRYDEVAG
jgi:uncharacterized protein